MKAQFKYSFRAYLPLRTIALTVVAVMNLVFGFLGYYNVYGQGGKITAVTLCSVALCGILVICIVTDFEMLRGLCSAPAGYLTALTPVESWKIILPRVVTILVEDIICLTVAITGVVVQSFIVSGLRFDLLKRGAEKLSTWGLPAIALGYLYIILTVFFCIVLAKSVFYSRRAGTFLAILATLAIAYAFSLTNFILAVFGIVDSVGIFYSISLVPGPTAGFLLYLLLSACKSAALFLASSYLMERKINI